MKSSVVTQINSETFFQHLNKLYGIWDKNYASDFDSLMVINPKDDGTNVKSIAVMGWLFGLNFPETSVAFTRKGILIFASEKKINLLTPLKDHPQAALRPITFVRKEKLQADNVTNHDQIVAFLTADGASKIGMLAKDKKVQHDDNFETLLKAKSSLIFDVSALISDCFLLKDDTELDNIRRASRITTYFLDKLIDEVKRIIDDDLSSTHFEICKKIEDMFDNNSIEMKRIEAKLSKFNIKKEFVDIGSSAIVQSGGNYTLKLLTTANKDPLRSDCIVAGFCCQYKQYNSCVYRTLLINPTNSQERNYEKVLALNKLLINSIKPKMKISALYALGADFLKQELPDFEVPTNFGYGIGLEYKENSLLINDKNDRVFEQGMTILIVTGFKDLKSGDKKYALLLTDVVIVTKDGVEPTTNEAEKKLDEISFSIEIDEAQEKKKAAKKENVENNLPDRRRRRGREEKDGVKLKSLNERNEHQQLLKEKKLEELKARVNENFSISKTKIKEIPYQRIECYKSKDDLPKDLQPRRIYVDPKANAVLFPINGVHVPFHINVIKNVSKMDQGKMISLRFNFFLPIGGVVGIIKIPPAKDNTIYIKELIYRMENTGGEPEVSKQIKELQKKMKMIADEQRNKEDMVDQVKLIINKNKKPLLRDLQARPYHIKKIKGILECHINGFRYTASKGEVIDVIFSNIKNAFFQPCEKEVFAALHFRLHEPIMIGKKKTDDVQFYAEIGSITEDVDRRNKHEEDSDEEERERIARKKLDKEFQAFIKACEEVIRPQDKFEFETPVREYGFDGAPFKVKSLLQPTQNCLMNVTDMPFFVMQLQQIEVACFQRMYANIRNFDLTFIYKDYERFIRVLSIPIEQVEKIKDWLDRSNIIFYDLQVNVKWGKFMQDLRSNFRGFVEEGGWSAWDSDEEEKLIQDEVEGDSEFQAESGEHAESEDESSGYSEEFDDDDDSGEYEDEDDLSEEGLDSEELEKQAEEEDRRKIKKELEAKNNPKKKK